MTEYRASPTVPEPFPGIITPPLTNSKNPDSGRSSHVVIFDSPASPPECSKRPNNISQHADATARAPMYTHIGQPHNVDQPGAHQSNPISLVSEEEEEEDNDDDEENNDPQVVTPPHSSPNVSISPHS